MKPTSDTTIQRPDLGMAIYETMKKAPEMGYIGLELMPYFHVASQAANYPVIPKEALFNLLDTKRGPLGHYNRSSDEFENGYYTTSENGLESRIDRRYAAIYGTQFAYELTIANILMNNILRAQEARIAAKLFSETAFETAIAASTAWATVASASPRDDVDTGKASMRALGITPDTLAMSYTNFLYLTKNAEVQAQVYQLFPDTAKTGQINADHLKTYFNVDKILVAGALKNTAKRGQDASLSGIWSDTYALLCKTSDGDITEPCVGRTFLWNEGAADEIITEQYYNDEVRSDVLRVRHDSSNAFLASFDEDGAVKSAISKAAGYLIDVTGN
jgi:hypothetical protein